MYLSSTCEYHSDPDSAYFASILDFERFSVGGDNMKKKLIFPYLLMGDPYLFIVKVSDQVFADSAKVWEGGAR